jgi:hypothetical protein
MGGKQVVKGGMRGEGKHRLWVELSCPVLARF